MHRYNNANCAGTGFYRCLIHMHANWCFQSKCSNISAEGLHFSAFHYNSYAGSSWIYLDPFFTMFTLDQEATPFTYQQLNLRSQMQDTFKIHCVHRIIIIIFIIIIILKFNFNVYYKMYMCILLIIIEWMYNN